MLFRSGIVNALEGMKIRKDREVILHAGSYPKLLVLGREDPVLIYNETCRQVEKTNMELVTLNGGHMSHIENSAEVLEAIQHFLKKT